MFYSFTFVHYIFNNNFKQRKLLPPYLFLKLVPQSRLELERPKATDFKSATSTIPPLWDKLFCFIYNQYIAKKPSFFVLYDLSQCITLETSFYLPSPGFQVNNKQLQLLFKSQSKGLDKSLLKSVKNSAHRLHHALSSRTILFQDAGGFLKFLTNTNFRKSYIAKIGHNMTIATTSVVREGRADLSTPSLSKS